MKISDAPLVRYKRPWWLLKRKRAVTFPPFGIWIDPRYLGTDVGKNVLTHELVHWEQYLEHKWTFLIRYGWQWVKARGDSQSIPYEIDAYRKSGVR